MEDKYQLKPFIINEFDRGNIRGANFPMLTTYGVRDYSESVHSTGLNYLTEIGRHIEGITSLSEFPVYPVNPQYSHRVTREVRPDSLWFEKETGKPLFIAEFERFENSKLKHNKLREKIENLLLAYHQLGGELRVILFVYWSYQGAIPNDIENYLRIFDEGYRMANGKHIPGLNSLHTKCLVFQAVASGSKESLTINQWIQVR
ncbi:hypothetical protein GCM10008018_45280 [Paenibacillus marchantiophytorum]|uniref:Uncharacterized protein n=1 Tax=Paenibacillus marchantiophytorum TaxID=1619310 RepID=A0ABQ1EYV5_9BACL|nr:hypothetical protein [Paenibacillus marchantiophytorum]GFZ93791.1 hypothetical protein GCM10008018_45280 [Paenibacillus marchantiophytorum]